MTRDEDASGFTEPAPLRRVTLLGQDHSSVGRYTMRSVGDERRTVCSISVGGPRALARKAGAPVPNEDGLFAADFGTSALHVIADGHRGHFASHETIERVASAVTGPADLTAPLRSLKWFAAPGPEQDPECASATTLSLCAIDRERGEVEGWSTGDSAVFHLSAERGIQRLDAPDKQYVSPGRGVGPELAATKRFRSLVRPGDVILSCSDGVFECHYGSPKTSLTSADLEALFIRFGADLDAFVEAISHDALMGVRGHPGGEDNIAIVASLV